MEPVEYRETTSGGVLKAKVSGTFDGSPAILHRKIPDASRRLLNMQLKELEDHELIFKTIYPVVPPKVEYSLSDFGETLIPVIGSLGEWADNHQQELREVILKKAILSS